MADHISQIQLGPHGPLVTVELGDGLVPDQDKPALYHVTTDREHKHLLVTRAESVTTKYAAVNGIMNDLDRAAVVMLDKVMATADLRRDDTPLEFTLFHLPERGFVHDVALAGAEKMGLSSRDSRELFRVQQKISESGLNVIWAVHSRGADVFNAAVRYGERHGFHLNNQTVAVFSGAANSLMMRENLAESGVALLGKGFYNPPFDLVPQVVALDTVNPLKWAGSILSVPALFTKYSPHTWHSTLMARDYNSVPKSQWELPGVDLRKGPVADAAATHGLLADNPANVASLAEMVANMVVPVESMNDKPATEIRSAAPTIDPKPPAPILSPAERIFPAAAQGNRSGPRH